MRELTQSRLTPPGDCWQTCVASILDLDPTELPSQGDYGPGYLGALQAYLREHHGLAYVELNVVPEVLGCLRLPEPGWHMMTGRTVRSEALGGGRHVVVGRHGREVWDPHPSRAGLLDDVRWGLLVPFPALWRAHGVKADPCECPAHGGRRAQS